MEKLIGFRCEKCGFRAWFSDRDIAVGVHGTYPGKFAFDRPGTPIPCPLHGGSRYFFRPVLEGTPNQSCKGSIVGGDCVLSLRSGRCVFCDRTLQPCGVINDVASDVADV